MKVLDFLRLFSHFSRGLTHLLGVSVIGLSPHALPLHIPHLLPHHNNKTFKSFLLFGIFFHVCTPQHVYGVQRTACMVLLPMGLAVLNLIVSLGGKSLYPGAIPWALKSLSVSIPLVLNVYT